MSDTERGPHFYTDEIECEDCKMEPVGLKCPACGEAPLWLFGGGTQAWCGTDDCPILTWDPTKTRAELNADSQVITLPVPGTDDKED